MVPQSQFAQMQPIPVDDSLAWQDMPVERPMVRRLPRSMGAADAPAPVAASPMLGLAILAVGAGAVIGGVMAGAMGALGGGLLGGAAVNGLRAAKDVTTGSPEADKEAAVSGTFALGGAAFGIWLLYKARGGDTETATPNKGKKADDDAEDEEPEAAPDVKEND